MPIQTVDFRKPLLLIDIIFLLQERHLHLLLHHPHQCLLMGETQVQKAMKVEEVMKVKEAMKEKKAMKVIKAMQVKKAMEVKKAVEVEEATKVKEVLEKI